MKDRLVLVWVVLVSATLLSWWLEASINGAWVGTAVLFVAFFKTRLVLLEFMHVRSAPAGLRWACESWVLIACSAVIATYWFAERS